MRDEILTHHEMCGREGGRSLQQGMHFRARHGYSILLMSTRRGAPYLDQWDEARGLLLYEGHDAKRSPSAPDPKTVDQPETTPLGRLTQNGLFFQAAQRFARDEAPAERVRVYEKIRDGIWSDKGMFLLIDARRENRNGRMVFVFMLQPIEDNSVDANAHDVELPHNRLIPTAIKVEVWKRDGGQCVICGSKTNLHFDHDLPFSKGGSSLTAANVKLLCAKHNLEKSDQIL